MTGPNHSSQPAETEGKSVANTPKKKLIETSLPLEAINAASAREKSIRHGHPPPCTCTGHANRLRPPAPCCSRNSSTIPHYEIGRASCRERV